MPPRERTAIICSGGGMKSVHGAGFLYVLGTELGIQSPNIMVGSSGDAGNILYFAAKQYEGIKRIWTKLLSTRKFIFFLRFWRIMDINYLIDVVFKKQEPLDTQALAASPIHWAIPITNYDDGKQCYATKEDKLDPFEVLRATAALPIFFGEKVRVGRFRYVDGEFGPILQDHVDYALRAGAKRILIINHTWPWSHVSAAIAKAYAAHAPEGMEKAIIRDVATNVFEMHAPGVRVLTVIPQNLPAQGLTRDQKKLQASFDQGASDARALTKELQELFGS